VGGSALQELQSPGFWSKGQGGQSEVEGTVGKRIMRIHRFSGERLSGVRCFVMSDPVTLAEPAPARAFVLPGDFSSRPGCESEVLGSSRTASRGSSRCRARGSSAGCPSPWELQAQLPAARALAGAVGSAAALEGLRSPSHAVHEASKPGAAGSGRRAGRSGIPSRAGGEAGRGLRSRQSG